MYNNWPLVSVCIPCYKHVDLFKRCLDSVINQSYKRLEIIITDDSRDDNIKNLVNNGYSDDRIIYLKNEYKKGSPANWNEGLLRAKGKYIKIMHHDDWFVSSESLEKMVDAIIISNSDLLFCNCINYIGLKKKKHNIHPYFLYKFLKSPHLILLGNMIGAPSVTLFSNKYLEILFDSKTQWYVDVLFYIEYTNTFNAKITFLRENLVNITAGSSSQVTSTINGQIVFTEAMYAYKKIKGLDFWKKNLIFNIHTIELFRKFGIPSINQLSMWGIDEESISYLKKVRKFALIPIPHQFYALLRRLYLKYYPL